MAGTKFHLKFNADADEGQGWGELHYKTITPSSDFAAELLSAAALGDTRKELLGPGFWLTSVVVSDMDEPRRYREVSYTKAAGSSSLFGGDASGEFVDAALLATKFSSDGRQHGRLFMRGLPASQVAQGGSFNPTGPFNTQFGLLKTLLSGTFGFLARTNKTKERQMRVDTIAANGNGSFTVTVTAVPPALALVAGQNYRLSLSGVEGATQTNGPNVYTYTGGVTFVSVKRLSIFPYVAGGIMTLYSPAVVLIGSIIKERITGHKTGGPFSKLRGRSKARNR